LTGFIEANFAAFTSVIAVSHTDAGGGALQTSTLLERPQLNRPINGLMVELNS